MKEVILKKAFLNCQVCGEWYFSGVLLDSSNPNLKAAASYDLPKTCPKCGNQSDKHQIMALKPSSVCFGNSEDEDSET